MGWECSVLLIIYLKMLLITTSLALSGLRVFFETKQIPSWLLVIFDGPGRNSRVVGRRIPRLLRKKIRIQSIIDENNLSLIMFYIVSFVVICVLQVDFSIKRLLRVHSV